MQVSDRTAWNVRSLRCTYLGYVAWNIWLSRHSFSDGVSWNAWSLVYRFQTTTIGIWEALGVGFTKGTHEGLDEVADYVSWNTWSLGHRLRLCHLEHMKPQTQVVKFMICTVNFKGSVLGNKARRKQELRKEPRIRQRSRTWMTQVVRFMTCTLNPKGSILGNKTRIIQEFRKEPRTRPRSRTWIRTKI